MTKILIKSALLAVVLLFVLFVDRFIMSWERMQLLGFWWAQGHSEWIDSHSQALAQKHKTELLTILATPSDDPKATQAALYFAAQMPNDPEVNERLRILADNTSNARVQCQAQTLLARKFEVTIYSADDPQPHVSTFVGVNDFACQPP